MPVKVIKSLVMDSPIFLICDMSVFITTHIFSSFEAGNCVSNSSFKWMKKRNNALQRCRAGQYLFTSKVRRYSLLALHSRAAQLFNRGFSWEESGAHLAASTLQSSPFIFTSRSLNGGYDSRDFLRSREIPHINPPPARRRGRALCEGTRSSCSHPVDLSSPGICRCASRTRCLLALRSLTLATLTYFCINHEVKVFTILKSS